MRIIVDANRIISPINKQNKSVAFISLVFKYKNRRIFKDVPIINLIQNLNYYSLVFRPFQHSCVRVINLLWSDQTILF